MEDSHKSEAEKEKGGEEVKYRGVKKRPRNLTGRQWLGTFNTAEEAARAYDRATLQLRGALSQIIPFLLQPSKGGQGAAGSRLPGIPKFGVVVIEKGVSQGVTAHKRVEPLRTVWTTSPMTLLVGRKNTRRILHR
ncbi:hypothetical protein V8G54_002843 [Vigna mungo]|uniref:AP2/ERF domain-containing protein n=1 Tax=Vigna mungo TaxID=3915 RepID=A0AAQ3PB11_VIGMU